jgi:hypothetical protein
MRAQYGYAAQHVLDAIQLLVNVHGAASFAENSLMQQYWRDANTAARHAGLNAFVGYEVFGKALLDVPEHRCIPVADVSEGVPSSDEPMRRLPFAPAANLALIGPLLGIGRAALAMKPATSPMLHRYGGGFHRLGGRSRRHCHPR